MSDFTRRRFLQTAGQGTVAFAGATSLAPDVFAQTQSLAGQTVTHWSFLSPDGSSLREQAIKRIVDSFEQQSGIEVAFEVFPWQDLATRLIAAVQAGSPPDSSRVTIFALKMVVNADALTSLDPYIEEAFPGDVRDDFLVDFAPEAMVNGSKWAMQIEVVPKAMFVRNDWLQEAGVEAPRTWPEFVEVGKALTGNGRWGYLFGASKTQLNQVETIFQPQIHGRGGQILDADGNPTFNDEAAVETYQFLRDCVHTHNITPRDVVGMTYDDVTDAFKSGRAGMFQEGSHRYRDVAQAIGEANLLLAKVPSDDPARPSPSVVTGWGIGIPRGSEHPDAAWEFIKHYIEPESQEINAQVAGTLPSRTSVLELPYFQTPEAAYMRWWIDYVAERGESVISIATYPQLNEVMVDALHQILLDPESDIQQVLDQAVEQYKRMVSL